MARGKSQSSGWGRWNGPKLHRTDEIKRSAGFIFIFGDIKQIVAARSVVNIKISFVVQVASVSCSLSESQQPSFFFLFLGCCQTLKTETPPPIIHSWKDFRCLTWQIWVLFWFFFLPYAVMQDAGGKKRGDLEANLDHMLWSKPTY